jgi:HSP20 family molecular chaperone IbpA
LRLSPLPPAATQPYDVPLVACGGARMSVTLASSEETFGGMARQMGKMLEQLNKGYYSFYPNETWTPNVNLYETDDAYQVCVDLAGVEKDKIDIEVHEQRLTLRGQRVVPTLSSATAERAAARTVSTTASEESQPRRTKVHLMEIDHGSFARVVELPHDVADDKISAEYRNGILWIEIPKK